MFLKFMRTACTDGVIDLVRLPVYEYETELGFGRCWEFMICPHGHRRDAGRISIRLGESEAVYYFGHIGYHVNPPYRGNGWALRACRLIEGLLREEGRTSVVITCDPDNIPSRKTIEKLGCTLERDVPVPGWLQKKYEISAEKCRYVWLLTERG